MSRPPLAPPTPAGRRAWLGLLAWSVPVLLAEGVVGLDLDVPVLRPVLALLVVWAVPLLVLHRRLRLPAGGGVARFCYTAGLAVLGTIVLGLMVDVVLPLVGVPRPFAPLPLAVASAVVDLALLAWRPTVALTSPGLVRTTTRRLLEARWRLAPALAFLGLVLAVTGAVRLNNGAGGGVALASSAVAAVALLVLLLDRRPHPLRDAWTVGATAAALLLGTSLRGWSITGHDIQAEFLAFRLTDAAQAWHPGTFDSAYNACLSVTILPEVLVRTTGLAPEVVFKVVLQLVFALVPVVVLTLGRRMMPRRPAIAGAILVMAFPTFFTDMPYLVRQEVAFFLMALMLLAATEPARTRIGTRVFVAVLGLGVVLSHYSTTYLLLLMLVVAALGLGAAGLLRLALRRGPAPLERPLVLLHPLVIAAVAVGAALWAGPVTHTDGHATSVVRETLSTLVGRSAAGPRSSDTSYALISRDRTTPEQRMHKAVVASLAYRDAEIPTYLRVLPHPGTDVLTPEMHDRITAPDTALGRALDRQGLDPVHIDNGLRLAAAVLMQLLAALGLFWSLRRRRRPAPPGRLRPSRDLAFLVWGAMTALGLVVLVPNLSVEYGVLRAFQQTLLVIAPMMAMGLWWLLRPVARWSPRRAATLLGLVPVLLLGILTGLLPAVLGGQQQRFAYASAGDYYNRFYASDAELTGLGWLGAVDHADTTNVRLIASRGIDVRLLVLSLNRAPVADRLFPTLLSKDGYVFIDSQILHQGTSTVFYTGDSLTYTYPLRLLDRHLDLVYSSPDARVYR